MQITYDPAKREKTFWDRGLDFEDARRLFSGPIFEFEDTRRDYGEKRVICYGVIEGRLWWLDMSNVAILAMYSP